MVAAFVRSRLAAGALMVLFLSFFGVRCQGADRAIPVKIGNSVEILTGPWKFHPGDNPAWAQPGFDDSNWGTMDLTPAPGSSDPVTGSSGYVRGWTAQGYPHLTHFAWYRLRANVINDAAESNGGALGLTMPIDVDDAYQVFVNGQLIGHFGKFQDEHVTLYNAQPRRFLLPDGLQSGPITIAIRMWMDSATPLLATDAGGLHGPPMLGQANSTEAMLRLEWDAVNRTQVGNLLNTALLLLGALLGLTLFRLDRREPAYLWLSLACLAGFLRVLTVLVGYYTTAVPLLSEALVEDVILLPLCLALWALFWAAWFGIPNLKRIGRIAFWLGCAEAISMAPLRPPLFGSVIPVTAADWIEPIALILKLAMGGLLIWITIKGIRKRASGGWLALVPILLSVLWAYQEELSIIHIPVIIGIGGITFNLGQIANVLMVVIISILLMQRFIQGQRERELWRLELEQARQVQQVLIPEKLPTIPGFALASEYRPAQHVGGDFFQIVPLRAGGVLAVIGDVSGKGMPAAMTVSLLVGTLRTLIEFTTSPDEILSGMNRRMIARSGGGFTTCLVLRIDPDGRCAVANAGHLSPYLDGQELTVEGGLPLGLSAESVYQKTEYRLDPGQQLTLLTDGVVEARAANGDLLGFARAAALACEPAEKIADAAQEFGQEDDITVLTLKRLALGEEAAIHVSTSVLATEMG
ncbi:MAG: SpoIIE family protein phosphatase [Acidobacteriota bacterium]